MNNDESEVLMSTTYSPSTTLPSSVDLDEMKASFQQHGYAVARGLFSDAEVEEIKINFARIAENGPITGHFEQVSKVPVCLAERCENRVLQSMLHDSTLGIQA